MDSKTEIIILGLVIGFEYTNEPNIAPKIIGHTFLKCFPKKPNPIIVNILPIVGPLKSAPRIKSKIVDNNDKIPTFK